MFGYTECIRFHLLLFSKVFKEASARKSTQPATAISFLSSVGSYEFEGIYTAQVNISNGMHAIANVLEKRAKVLDLWKVERARA